MARKLVRVVPVRVSRRDSLDLRRWAREKNGNVSEVIRDLIDERRRQCDGESDPSSAVDAAAAAVEGRQGQGAAA